MYGSETSLQDSFSPGRIDASALLSHSRSVAFAPHRAILGAPEADRGVKPDPADRNLAASGNCRPPDRHAKHRKFSGATLSAMTYGEMPSAARICLMLAAEGMLATSLSCASPPLKNIRSSKWGTERFT
jgi:hypothetical protein